MGAGRVRATATTRIAHAFQQADLPAELVGDLRALVEQVHTPLAVRSSSLLEDALDAPVRRRLRDQDDPQQPADAETRFRKLVEAIKFVYASTFFARRAGLPRARSDAGPRDEKMAVIIQEVVGRAARRPLLPGPLRRGALVQLLPLRRTRARGRRREPGARPGQDDRGRRASAGPTRPRYPRRHAAVRVAPRPARGRRRPSSGR